MNRDSAFNDKTQHLNNIEPVIPEKSNVTNIEKTFTALEDRLTIIVQTTTSFCKPVDMEHSYTEEEYQKAKIKLLIQENRDTISIGTIYLIAAIHSIYLIIQYIKGIYYINPAYTTTSIFIWTLALIIPFAAWIYSTKLDYYNYYNRKLLAFTFCLINASIFVPQFLLKISIQLFVPLALKIPVSIYVTENMIINLSRFIIFIFSFIPVLFLEVKILELVYQDDIRDTILDFRLQHYVDLRKNTDFNYDMNVLHKLDTGEKYTIKQEDRKLHTALDGTTGTGKTSSIMTVSIADDLDQRKKNENYQKTELFRLLKQEQAMLKVPFEDNAFRAGLIQPTADGKEQYDAILAAAPLAGITVMAPNAQFADEIYELASTRGIKVNRVDPTILEEGEHKTDFIGFNPMYISPHLSPLLRNFEVTKKARVCADVLQALYEMNGKGDPYFTSLNRNVTTCLTILILLTYDSLHKRKANYPDFKADVPTLIIIQDILYDFDKANDYVMEYEYLTDTYSAEELGFDKKDYAFVIDLVKNDLLGAGREAMYDQARGLRTIIDSFLSNPLFRKALCCQKSIDMDQMLAEGEITIVNYALELGKSDATAFGLFFALSYNNAVLRRPAKNRTPHFYYIDEFPVLLHPSMEECFTLFRQYNVSMCVAIQTFDQMDKSEVTKYMRGILQGNCATQFVFGRISTTEMEEYEKLGGTIQKQVDQTTISQTALSMADTSMSFSIRSTPEDVAVVSGSKMRNLQFQEVTVFTVNQGSPIPAFYGKVNFLKKYKKLKRVYKKFDWSVFYPLYSESDDAADRQSLGNASTVSAIQSDGSHVIIQTYPYREKNSSLFTFSSGQTSISINHISSSSVKEEPQVNGNISDTSTDTTETNYSTKEDIKITPTPEDSFIDISLPDDIPDEEYFYFEETQEKLDFTATELQEVFHD